MANAYGDGFWLLARSACYLRGKGVTFGAPFIPHESTAKGVYSISIGLAKVPAIGGVDTSLEVFADGSLDHVVVTPQICAHESPSTLLREVAHKLKLGGHLVVVLNNKPDEEWQKDLIPADIKQLVGVCARWRIKCEHSQDGRTLLILKRIEGRKGIEPMREQPLRRACIARYGALGDAIIMTPLIKALYDDGYEVTLNISPYCAAVFENNPYISNIITQEKDIIPNGRLGEYWDLWAGEYTKYINLSESLEGDLLMVEGRPSFFTSKSWRHKQCDKNYYDYTLARSGYPHITGKNGELFFTRAEERRAEKFFSPLREQGKFVIVWALNGSSHHKTYPLMQPTLKDWLAKHPNACVVTVGDYAAKLSEFAHPQLMPRAGEWSLRESMLAAKYADLVIGPETMMTNAAGCFSTPKITFLSHSSHENLCKYWENDYCLAPSEEIAPCYPCHSLHYTKESCPIGEMQDTSTGEVLGQAPICTMAIDAQRLMHKMDEVYVKKHSPLYASNAS